MASSVLKKDADISFPHFTVLKASAGSGKTHALTERFVQFILSENIPRNRLRNILAITFSNNAAREMKERILCWLKSVCLGDEERITGLIYIVSLDREKMMRKAGFMIEEILDNYADFQVRTIDSFMTSVFKVSAIDFGYNPEFEILMNSDALMKYAFNLFLKEVKEGTAQSETLMEIIRKVLENKGESSAYLWDPSRELLEEIQKISGKLSSQGREAGIRDYSREMLEIAEEIRKRIEKTGEIIRDSGLDENKGASFRDIAQAVKERRFTALIGKGLKKLPVNKPKKLSGKAAGAYQEIAALWQDLAVLTGGYATYYAYSYYHPYLEAYRQFSSTIEAVKRRLGRIFINDINRYLSLYLSKEVVPDVYFRIGETIFHYLIDEFQDTSPIQWRNLFPLMENSLSQGGSLFIVGDTKQAVYGFRDTDYRIMKSLESANPFPSAEHDVKELIVNYRSAGNILKFNERVFHGIAANHAAYSAAALQSGLSDYIQRPDVNRQEDGYVEAAIYERDDEHPPERTRIQELVRELSAAGYGFNDIAILASRNEDVVRVTSWLSEKDIPFISYSSLDIRRRKITGEIVSLLSFLDSPTDDLSFAAFLLGEIFSGSLSRSHCEIHTERLREFLFASRDEAPVYKAFQKEFPEIWEQYFAGLFKSAGYLPLYDLASLAFAVFKVFGLLADEEATLAKILEVIKEFEGEGYNSLRDFLTYAADTSAGGAEWNMAVPKGTDAVKVMTVHKAKGLGFPVVIVLLYGKQNRGFGCIVHEDGDEMALLKINKNILVNCNKLLEEIYAEEQMNETVDRLNSLYVGFTRAEEKLYVIGVRRKRDAYPFDLLTAAEFAPSESPGRIRMHNPERIQSVPVYHHDKPAEFPVIADELKSAEERRRGEFIHRVFSRIEYIDEGFEEALAHIIRMTCEETGEHYPADEIKAAVAWISRDDTLKGFFRNMAEREIKREQEFSDRKGRLFRMDRVVVDKDTVTVIDYKTGREPLVPDAYRKQMKNYASILGELYPEKQIMAIIAYADVQKVEQVI
jgi:ATP-dependent exoDNAse (exonuclease V) beta subunit